MGDNGQQDVIEQPAGTPPAGDEVVVATVTLNRRTSETVLHVAVGVNNPVGFAKTLSELAIQYAVERAVAATQIERASLADIQRIERARR